jgi:hypothetical protein
LNLGQRIAVHAQVAPQSLTALISIRYYFDLNEHRFPEACHYAQRVLLLRLATGTFWRVILP